MIEGGTAQITLPPNGDNQHAMVTQYIGLVEVTIDYYSPDVTSPSGDDRTGEIWGQLVPYGFNQLGFGLNNPSPWRAGANQNTTIEFSHDVEIEGKSLSAGKYGLFIAPQESGPWTLIFSEKNQAWGSFFYDEAHDALRVEVEAEDSQFHEWLTYEFIERSTDQAVAAMMWENKKLPFTISVPYVNELYMASIKDELTGPKGFTWLSWNQAANFVLQNDLDLETGLKWADAAVNAPFIGQANFTTLSTKAQILAKMGKAAESDQTMEKAINHPTATSNQIHAYGRQLITAGKKEEALEVFKMNHKRFDGSWPTNYGLARAYAALGNYKKALKYLKTAKDNVPANDTLNPTVIEANIKKLENGEDIN